MKDLTHYDYGKILNAVEILNSGIDAQSLPKRLVNAVNRTVAGDITAFEMVSAAGEYQGCLVYEPLDAISAKELEIYNRYISEHPFYEQILYNQRFDAIKIADFLPDGNFLKTGIYNEYYRRISIDRQISVTMRINSDCLVFCTMSRNRLDFSETERAMLNLLSPHMTSAIRNSNYFQERQIDGENWQSVAEGMGCAIVTFDSEGKLKYLSDSAAELFERYFPKTDLMLNGLPDELFRRALENIEMLKMKEFSLPPKPLIFNEIGKQLVVRFSFNITSQLINLLLLEEKKLTPDDLLHLGLTKRETEILYWIGCGKSNSEIAVLCRIAVRTVHKHVEHIFTKLGVETRTAAAMRVSEFVSSL